jgi:signal transduction histidine kinase
MIRHAVGVAVYLATASILWVSLPPWPAFLASAAFAGAHWACTARMGALSRRGPAPGMVLVAALLGAAWATTGMAVVLPSSAVLLVALFRDAALAPRTPWASLGVGLAAAVLGGLLLTSDSSVTQAGLRPGPVPVVAALCFLVGLAFSLGLLRRAQLREVSHREEYIRLLEDLNQQAAELATAAERQRITAEIHDVVSHNLAVIASQARGAQWLEEEDRDQLAAALKAIEDTGRSALADMRAVLRTGPNPTESRMPGLGDLAELLDRVRAAGLPVAFSETGPPPANGRAPVLTRTAQLAIYRCVQEALTNILRHASAAKSAELNFRWMPAALEITISDDGGKVAVPEASGGLRVMMERFSGLAGNVKIESGSRGLIVRATVPVGVPTIPGSKEQQ